MCCILNHRHYCIIFSTSLEYIFIHNFHIIETFVTIRFRSIDNRCISFAIPLYAFSGNLRILSTLKTTITWNWCTIKTWALTYIGIKLINREEALNSTNNNNKKAVKHWLCIIPNFVSFRYFVSRMNQKGTVK